MCASCNAASLAAGLATLVAAVAAPALTHRQQHHKQVYDHLHILLIYDKARKSAMLLKKVP
jgi:hypothetical protein